MKIPKLTVIVTIFMSRIQMMILVIVLNQMKQSPRGVL